MEERRTMLVLDKAGRYHVAVRGSEAGDTYQDDKEVLRLFVEENERFGECEVMSLDETVDCA